MPVRSSLSSVLRWPDAQTVDRAVRRWALQLSHSRSDVRRIGYFGSYARGDGGVGSDLDLIIIVATSERAFVRRAADWDTTSLPVPADLLVYTQTEWHMLEQQNRLPHSASSIIWIWEYPTAYDSR